MTRFHGKEVKTGRVHRYPTPGFHNVDFDEKERKNSEVFLDKLKNEQRSSVF